MNVKETLWAGDVDRISSICVRSSSGDTVVFAFSRARIVCSIVFQREVVMMPSVEKFIVSFSSVELADVIGEQAGGEIGCMLSNVGAKALLMCLGLQYS